MTTDCAAPPCIIAPEMQSTSIVSPVCSIFCIDSATPDTAFSTYFLLLLMPCASPVMKSGIHLTGGAAQLFGLDQYIAQELDIPVLLARDPMNCAALGAGHLADNMEDLHRIGKSSFLREEGEE